MGNGVENGARHLTLKLRELSKWGKDDIFVFGRVEFEMTEPSEKGS